MKRSLLSVMFLLLAIVARAGEPSAAPPKETDPKALVQRLIEAISKIQVVSYEVEYNVEGWFTYFLPSFRGSVTMGKDTEQKTQRYRVKLSIKPSGASEPFSVTAGADGKEYYVVDDAAKTVYADIDPAVAGKNRFGVEFAMVREFAAAEPFYDVLKTGEVSVEESMKIDDEDCVGLRIKSPNQPEAVWYLSKRDTLPRRISVAQTNEKGEKGTADMTLHKLVVNPTFVRNPFELEVPPGYKKTDEFAP